MRLPVALFVLALAGCAASGVQVSEQAATQFREGVSTEADIVKALGQPTSVSVTSGIRFISYVGYQHQVKAATFIPIVGAFAGGADYRMTVATYQIGADGILQRVSYTAGGSGTQGGALPVDMAPTPPRAVK